MNIYWREISFFARGWHEVSARIGKIEKRFRPSKKAISVYDIILSKLKDIPLYYYLHVYINERTETSEIIKKTSHIILHKSSRKKMFV